ncbi:Transposase [Oopsacas minuta]|uniref:Transposase n=1 Tax=Oopsacas minuta TaxID=111878 RepID=A0AAV7KKE8_9METZ|nr:Transposase [Oopsacas minuta]
MASKNDNFNLKWRAYIEFRTILKIQSVQIFSELQEILCMDCPSRSTVERWAALFRSGDADVTDLPRSRRPVSTTTSENIALIESMVMEDKCITVNQLEQSREISSGAIHTILTTELGYRLICGKWLLHKLSENQRLAIALRGHRESDEEPSHANRGNFLEILVLVAQYDPIIARKLQEGPQNAKYAHQSNQDNVIHVAADLIREQIAAETNGSYYAIIVDESRATSHKEQMSLVLRCIVQEDEIHGKNVIKESVLGFAACGVSPLLIELCHPRCCARYSQGGRPLHTAAVVAQLPLITDCPQTVCQGSDSCFPDSQPREIPSLSETRWVCRHDACETLGHSSSSYRCSRGPH